MAAKSPQPVLFLQFGDPQVGMGLDGAKGDRARFKYAAEHAERLFPGRDKVVLLCGDLIHWISMGKEPCPPEELEGAKEGKKMFNGDVLVLPGNHDIFDAPSRKLYLETHGLAESYFSHTFGNVTFIVLDSTTMIRDLEWYPTEEEREHGRRQWEWMERELEEATGAGRQVIMTGHYPVYIFTEEEEECYWTFSHGPRKKFMDLMRRFGVRHYLCGHMHRTFAATTAKGDFTVWVVGGTSTVADEEAHGFGYRAFEIHPSSASRRAVHPALAGAEPLTVSTTSPGTLFTSYLRLNLPKELVPPSSAPYAHMWPKLPKRPKGISFASELAGPGVEATL